MAVQTGPHDAQDGEGRVRADEGGGEERGHDMEGERGGMDERGEEGGDGAGEGAEHEGVEAERPDVGAGLSVGRASPPAVCLLSSVHAIACQIMFEKFRRLAERGSCLRILILYLTSYSYHGTTRDRRL